MSSSMGANGAGPLPTSSTFDAGWCPLVTVILPREI
jgi:hypothetical protein